ncbi:MAG: 1-acyl-sn-glycerol-3-phosphate acyltransferase [Xanthobacteraceae bacterium]|nr:1-acyl-sn-glycerol-3-phosphate acyltransferase [Xanthobacteraceae bacterium]QYK45115.1 MAG: 1-acyl-sn-glycerol-3-phosphate acyltransferase [Xanthobacteraceae bacterium]
MRAAFRIAVLGSVIAVVLPAQWVALKLRLRAMHYIPVWFHRFALRVLDVRVKVNGDPAKAERPLLFVSNHNSWLDIVVLGSVAPLSFVAKSEIAKWPVFGTMARMQRSIFVDRSRRHATGDVNRAMAAHLADGDPIVLFGEGTSSDGNRVLPFRSALLGSLRDAMEQAGRSYLQPVSIAYCRFHGIPMGRQHREVAAWFGDMDLIPHLMRVVREGAIDVEVRFGPVLEVSHTDDRKMLNRRVENIVRQLTANSLAGRPESPHVEAVPSDGETR